jgi:hypothetical protein
MDRIKTWIYKFKSVDMPDGNRSYMNKMISVYMKTKDL